MNWGKELWDQREAIEKHTEQGIQFLDKCSAFVKERIRIEQDYAKALRHLCKRYSPKKKEEEELNYTYQVCFRDIVKETNDLAGQHEVVAETMQEKVLKEMHDLSTESKTERKKHISELNDLKSVLESYFKSLTNTKKDYEKASQEAEVAMKAYDTASNSMDLTKAQIMKFQTASKDKGTIAEKAKDDYRLALENFNKTQTLYYEHDMPEVIHDKMQKAEENRVEKIGQYFLAFSECQRSVLNIIDTCLKGMDAAAKSCNPQQDSASLVDAYKTGNHFPGNVEFEEYGRPTLQQPTPRVNPSPRPLKTIKTKGFFMSSKKKEVVTNETVANDYSNLPPEQRKKKFLKRIRELEDQASQLSKARDGMIKMAETCQQFKGDIQTIQGQMDENDRETDRVNSLLYQYQCYLAAIEGTEAPSMPEKMAGSTSLVSIASTASGHDGASGDHGSLQHDGAPAFHTSELPPPPPTSPPDGFDEEFDDIRCHVLFDFAGTSEGELTISAGEELSVIEEDDGSGWTRVVRGSEEGYVPTSYVERL